MSELENAETGVDELYARVHARDQRAFATWMGRVERPLRASLRHFARAVDVECILQETFLRMWLLATEQRRELEGPNASLRFALGMARNLARNEARRLGRASFLPNDALPEVPVEPQPSADHGLAEAIRGCFEKLSGTLAKVLRLRIERGGDQPDRNLAKSLDMKLNTFLQSVVRARRQMRQCLEKKGIAAWELQP